MHPPRKLLVGVDEAGYGPNLGPLVVVAAALDVPADTPSADLWNELAPDVSKFPAQRCDALVIDDSKRVYSAGEGLADLERLALAWIGLGGQAPRSLRDTCTAHCLTSPLDIVETPWANRDVQLPRHTSDADVERAQRTLADGLARAGFRNARLKCQIVMPGRLNALVREHGSKAAALFQAGAQLLQHIWFGAELDEIEVTLDKHGGRNFYGPLLQQAFEETLVLAGREGATASQYTLSAAGRRLRATFLPRADGRHLLVAAASMVAKYLRELCMELFNAFWAERIPGLQPTAGYPTDARRFWKAIAPVAKQAGIPKHVLWRIR